MKKTTRIILSIAAIAVLLAVLLFLQANERDYGMVITIIEKSAIYAVVAVSMNLLNGFTGLFSLGQAGFMAIGAYTFSILAIPASSRASVYYATGINPIIEHAELPIPLAMIAGGLMAALFAAVIGFPILRLKSDYLAIATLGFSEIVRAIIASPQMNTITNGSFGLKKIPEFPNLLTVILVAAICIAIMVLLINSSYGRAFKAIREDEIAAEAMGIGLLHHKQTAFIISSFFAGIGGAMLARFMRSIDSNTFKIALTYDILLIVVIGGMGSVTGSVLAAFLVTASKEQWLRFFDEPLVIGGVSVPFFKTGLRMVVFSVLLMVVVLFFRRGIMGQNEFTWEGLFGLFKKIPNLFKGKKKKEAI
ncbi:MAG: branched-chain amino acid ABC transporter permease [Lachnospiraceae bacterium]|nr:branched-chain amino acid ABC transporter permease [Lachnospiraceae bacterium]